MAFKDSLHIPSFIRPSGKKRGVAPGEVQHIGEQKVEKTTVHAWSYNQTDCKDEQLTTIKEFTTFQQKEHTHWLNIIGLHDTNALADIGEYFSIHKLALEDIANTGQRPKKEEYDNALFVVAKMLHYNSQAGHVDIEQVSLLLTENVLLSFQEKAQDAFNPIRERMRTSKGMLRSGGADYLLYRLLDAIVDEYFVVLDHLGAQIEELEQQSLEHTDDQYITSIHALRRQVLFVRKAIAPIRDVLHTIERTESNCISEQTLPFFHDVEDHAAQALDALDTFRDLLSNALDNYLSLMSHKMNTVMKLLTVMASIFIPLTFIVGVYGMNFAHMPELEWQWAYPTVWLIMISLSVGMIVYFKKKKWL